MSAAPTTGLKVPTTNLLAGKTAVLSSNRLVTFDSGNNTNNTYFEHHHNKNFTIIENYPKNVITQEVMNTTNLLPPLANMIWEYYNTQAISSHTILYNQNPLNERPRSDLSVESQIEEHTNNFFLIKLNSSSFLRVDIMHSTVTLFQSNQKTKLNVGIGSLDRLCNLYSIDDKTNDVYLCVSFRVQGTPGSHNTIIQLHADQNWEKTSKVWEGVISLYDSTSDFYFTLCPNGKDFLIQIGSRNYIVDKNTAKALGEWKFYFHTAFKTNTGRLVAINFYETLVSVYMVDLHKYSLQKLGYFILNKDESYKQSLLTSDGLLFLECDVKNSKQKTHHIFPI